MTPEERSAQYTAETTACAEIYALHRDEHFGQACNRLAAHVRQQALISARGEHAIILLERQAEEIRDLKKRGEEALDSVLAKTEELAVADAYIRALWKNNQLPSPMPEALLKRLMDEDGFCASDVTRDEQQREFDAQLKEDRAEHAAERLVGLSELEIKGPAIERGVRANAKHFL